MFVIANIQKKTDSRAPEMCKGASEEISYSKKNTNPKLLNIFSELTKTILFDDEMVIVVGLLTRLTRV
jgi:hypothetical protein